MSEFLFTPESVAAHHASATGTSHSHKADLEQGPNAAFISIKHHLGAPAKPGRPLETVSLGRSPSEHVLLTPCRSSGRTCQFVCVSTSVAVE